MKKLDIGLVLSGGGARGSYQLGVMAALQKYRIYDEVKAVAGGSIGSFSSMLFLIKDLETCYHIWKDMDSERVLGYKEKFTAKIPIKDRGLFSRTALLSYIYRKFDLNKLLATDIPVYSVCSKIIKHRITKSYIPEYFLLNYKDQDYIAQVLLATSAIPFVFDAVQIENDLYVDCLKTDNEPSKPLEQYDLDFLFIVPLTDTHKPEKYKEYDIPVVDFMAEELMEAPMINMLEFDPSKTEYYINLGYYVGCVLLQYLKDHGAFRNSKTRDYPNYISLRSLGIKLEPQKLFSMEEIIEDVKKGVK